MSVVNTFFYEELTRVAGREVGSQWLSQTSGHNQKKRKSSSSSFSSAGKTADSSSPVSPSISSCCADPIHSCSSTLVSGECSDPGVTQAPKIHLDLLPNLHTKSSWPEEMFMTTDSVTKLHSNGNHDEDTMGLIYTDAAHTVLD
jgi:hypothetical protein